MFWVFIAGCGSSHSSHPDAFDGGALDSGVRPIPRDGGASTGDDAAPEVDAAPEDEDGGPPAEPVRVDGGVVGPDGSVGVCCELDPSPGCGCTFVGGWKASAERCQDPEDRWCDVGEWSTGTDSWGCPI